MKDRNRKRRSHGEKGLYLLFFAIMALVLISIIALALEIGRMMVASRQLQNAADSAALAGVQALHPCVTSNVVSHPLDNSCGSFEGTAPPPLSYSRGGWRAVKPAVIIALTNVKILGRPLGYFGLTEEPSQCDDPDLWYGVDLKFRKGTNETGDFTVLVTRMFECSTAVPAGVAQGNVSTVTFIPIDGNAALSSCASFPYCLANAVRVDLTYSGLSFPLARVFGFVPSKILTRTGIASIRRNDAAVGAQCYKPNCALLSCAPNPAFDCGGNDVSGFDMNLPLCSP